MNCRHCNSTLEITVADLGTAPPSNSYLRSQDMNAPDVWYPLRVLVCRHCWLVQTEDFNKAEDLFNASYSYFSSFSTSWLEHSKKYVTTIIERFHLNNASHVVEIASNDGYLLQYFKENAIPCLGVEPTESTSHVAIKKGLHIIQDFFTHSLAEKMEKSGRSADLMIANNVLAHVPDINDFLMGFCKLLKPTGVATFEFPNLLNLIQNCLFDTIYHEHYSYLSLTAVKGIFEKNGLEVFDVENLQTHGGSLRVFAQRKENSFHKISQAVGLMLAEELEAGLKKGTTYMLFQSEVERKKNNFLSFLLEAKKSGKKVGAYGAAAKGNTILNLVGVRKDLLPFVVDRNPAKQNKFMPGSRIPIVSEDVLSKEKPDYVLLFPWNLKTEIKEQLSYIKKWNGKFVVLMPELEVFQ